MRHRIFITQPVAESAIQRLRAAGEVSLNPDPLHIVTKHELIEAARASDVLFCLLHDWIDREVITANPSLKAVPSMRTAAA